jgi:dipeptide/tripeptide permease
VLSKSICTASFSYLLSGNEFCERLAFYGLATNLVTYITRVMGGDPATAAIQVSIFEGTCYITPLIGAYLADSLWGRYKTILVFSSIYFLVSAVLLCIVDASCCA